MTDTTFSTRNLPWMKLGTQIDEAVTAQQAAELAGLTWEVEVQPAGFLGKDGNWHEHVGRVCLVRSDTQVPLSNRGEGYEVVQYHEAFDFLDRINPEFVAAGELRGGKQAFMAVKLPEHVQLDVLDGQDAHDLYIVVRASHDASTGVEANFLPLRGACMNMLSLPRLPGAVHRLSFRHTKSVHVQLSEAQALLNGATAYAEEFQRTATKLAETDLELEAAKRILDEVVPASLESHDKRVTDILNLYQNSSRNGFTGTAWGLLNAVGEWNDHHRGGERRSAETRFMHGIDGDTQKDLGKTLAVLQRR